MADRIKIIVDRIFMTGAGLFFFALALILLGAIFNLEMSRDWDVLAFAGSIIGGLLTLFGVRLALINQRKDDFVNRFPERLLCIDSIMQEIYDRQHEIGRCLAKMNINQTMNAVYEFMQLQDEIKRQSIIAGADAYDQTLKVFRALKKMEAAYQNEDEDPYVTLKLIQQERMTMNDPLNELLQIKGRLLKRYSAYHD